MCCVPYGWYLSDMATTMTVGMLLLRLVSSVAKPKAIMDTWNMHGHGEEEREEGKGREQ